MALAPAQHAAGRHHPSSAASPPSPHCPRRLRRSPRRPLPLLLLLLLPLVLQRSCAAAAQNSTAAAQNSTAAAQNSTAASTAGPSASAPAPADCACGSSPCRCAFLAGSATCHAQCTADIAGVTLPSSLHSLSVDDVLSSAVVLAVLGLQLPQLRELRVQADPGLNVNLNELGPPLLQGLPGLRRLALLDANMNTVHVDTFAAMTNLTALTLVDLDTSSIPYDALQSVRLTLRELSLRSTFIGEVNFEEMKAKLPALRHLDLSNNNYITKLVPSSKGMALQTISISMFTQLPLSLEEEQAAAATLQPTLLKFRQATALTIFGMVPLTWAAGSMPHNSNLRRLFINGASKLAVQPGASLAASVFESALDWRFLVLNENGTASEDVASFIFNPSRDIECRMGVRGSRGPEGVVVGEGPRRGFPHVSCTCTAGVEGSTGQVDTVETRAPTTNGMPSCPAREPIFCSGTAGEQFYPWQLCDGVLDCDNQADERHCRQRWVLDRAATRAASPGGCEFQDWFEEDAACSADCMAAFDVRVEAGIYHLSAVEPGESGGCTSANVCPEGRLWRVNQRDVSGAIGLTTMGCVWRGRVGLS